MGTLDECEKAVRAAHLSQMSFLLRFSRLGTLGDEDRLKTFSAFLAALDAVWSVRTQAELELAEATAHGHTEALRAEEPPAGRSLQCQQLGCRFTFSPGAPQCLQVSYFH